MADALLATPSDVYVIPEHFRRHDGAAFTDPIVDAGYSIEEIPFVSLSFESGRSQVDRPGEGWWTLAVLTRLPVLERRTIALGHTPHDPVPERYALHLKLDVAGVPVDLVALHVSSKLWWGAPLIHLSRLRANLPALAERPAVLAGDFNMWGPLVERLLPGWRRSVKAKTYPSARPHSQIDHVLVNGHVEPRGGDVLAPTISDHLALRSRLGVATYPPQP